MSSVANTDATSNHDNLAIQINLSKKNRPLNENPYDINKLRESSIIS
jgi:hypothetical protein